MSFYNTVHLTGEALREAIASCNRQESEVRDMYLRHGDMTPSECHVLLIRNRPDSLGLPPITSIRRAITNLTERGLLHKTAELRPGPHGKPEHVWSANAICRPSLDGEAVTGSTGEPQIVMPKAVEEPAAGDFFPNLGTLPRNAGTL